MYEQFVNANKHWTFLRSIHKLYGQDLKCTQDSNLPMYMSHMANGINLLLLSQNVYRVRHKSRWAAHLFLTALTWDFSRRSSDIQSAVLPKRNRIRLTHLSGGFPVLGRPGCGQSLPLSVWVAIYGPFLLSLSPPSCSLRTWRCQGSFHIGAVP